MKPDLEAIRRREAIGAGEDRMLIMMTRDELDAIRRRAEAATPGPWTRTRFTVHTAGPNPFTVASSFCALQADEPNEANGEFIAAARQDVPALIAELAEAVALLGELEWGTDDDQCDVCGAWRKPDGLHHATCRLGRLLGRPECK